MQYFLDGSWKFGNKRALSLNNEASKSNGRPEKSINTWHAGKEYFCQLGYEAAQCKPFDSLSLFVYRLA